MADVSLPVIDGRSLAPQPTPGRGVRWTATGAYAALLVVLAVIPSPARYVAPGVSDSTLHAVAYGVLALLVAWSVEPSPAGLLRAAMAGVAGGVVLGIGTELLQGLVPWRTAELRDVRSDLIGAAVGAALWVLLARLRALRTGPGP